jgi:erythromycin esterase-like protein
MISMVNVLLHFVLISSAHADSAGLYPVSGIDPSAPTQDLIPIASKLRGAQVVGLGEVSHGTQSDQARHRIAKFLVENLGFRVILAEYPMLFSLRPEVQKYLMTCQGDIQRLFRFNYYVFHTQETINFMKWVCEYNVKHPQDPLRLIGADVLYQPWAIRIEFDKIKPLLPNHAQFLAQLEMVRSQCFGAKYNSAREWYESAEYKDWEKSGTLPQDPHRSCLAATSEIKKIFQTEKKPLTQALGESAYRFLMLLPGTLLANNIDASDYRRDLTGSQTFRDRVFFENFMGLWQNLGFKKKVIFMAHNYHVAKAQSKTENRMWPNVVSAGEHLSRLLRDKYKVIALSAFRVKEFYSSEPPVLPTSADSLDAVLNQMPSDHYLVDTRGAFVAKKPRWYLMAGNSPEFPNGARMIPKEQYDLVFYMRNCLEATYIKP